MSQEPTRKSVRLRSASYRPRTTWRLPEIVSVRFSACETDTSLNFDFFSKGVAPTSFTGQHHRHQDIETYLQETASSPTVPYHPVRRGNQAATQQMPVLRDETETLAMSE